MVGQNDCYRMRERHTCFLSRVGIWSSATWVLRALQLSIVERGKEGMRWKLTSGTRSS